MRITTNDGITIVNHSPEAIVRSLWDREQARSSSLYAFMRATAKRTKLWNGARISTDCVHTFLTELEGAGLVVIDWAGCAPPSTLLE